MGKRKRIGQKYRIAIFVVLLALLSAMGWYWLTMKTWRPDPQKYPSQGAYIADIYDHLDFVALAAVGAKFVYLQIPDHRSASDHRLFEMTSQARAAGLRVGFVLDFNPCLDATKQSALLTTLIPRDGAFLATALRLEQTNTSCPAATTVDRMISELTTLINQIETHTGKAVVFYLFKPFEREVSIAYKFDRKLWLAQDRFEPDYAGRPWEIWTANSAFESDATLAPVSWITERP